MFKRLLTTYWIADAPVIWIDAWRAHARKRRQNEERDLKSSIYDLASCSCSYVMLSWIWLNSA